MKTDTPQVMTETTGRDALHLSWGLSYASYLVLPRSMMQSMPDEWQGEMADLLEQMESVFVWPENGQIEVILRNEEGETIDDPYQDYGRGKRIVQPNAKTY